MQQKHQVQDGGATENDGVMEVDNLRQRAVDHDVGLSYAEAALVLQSKAAHNLSIIGLNEVL